MSEYTPNSHKYREEQKSVPVEKPKVEKVITGTAKVKKNEMRRLADIFIAEDVTNVKSYVLTEVVVPAIKNVISDIVVGGVNMLFFGSTTRKGGSGVRGQYVDYSSRFTGGSRFVDQRDESQNRPIRSYEDIVLTTRGEAEEVLRRMDELVETYEKVSIADLFDLCGLSCEYTDNKYGWYNIRNAEVVRTRDGYKIKLPRATSLK